MNAPAVDTGEEHLIDCKNCGAQSPFNRDLRCPECNIRLWGHGDEREIFRKREGEKATAWLVELPLFRIHELDARKVHVGRSSADNKPDIDCSRDPAVSRRQAVIHTLRRKGSLRIFITDGEDDRGSRNGTRVNGERIDPGRKVELFDGDTIRAGYTCFTVIIQTGGEA
jgi:hypothetical protein